MFELTPPPTCDCCGLPTDGAARFALGRWWCAECWSGQRPPVAMPPTAAEKASIAAWIAPRRATP